MRSVFFHLSVTRIEVEAYFATLTGILSEDTICEKWYFPPESDSQIYIRLHDYSELTFEPEHLTSLKNAFQEAEPTLCICADVSGRIVGLDEVTKLSNLILSVFEGFAEDDYSDHLWTLGEIRAGLIVDGLRFFDTERYYQRSQTKSH